MSRIVIAPYCFRCSPAAQNTFTPTNGRTCKDYSKPQFGH
jgi:hypothetical protein